MMWRNAEPSRHSLGNATRIQPTDIQSGAMTMSKSQISQPRMRIAAIGQIVMALAVATSAHGQTEGPCRQIAAACRDAGFVQGGARNGEGIQVDCIRPIMLGIAQPRNATKPLPPLDAQIVAACKARNADFGQPGRRAPPPHVTPLSPPPPAEAAPLPVPAPQAGEGNK